MTVVADVLRGDLPFPDKNHGFNAWFLRDSGVADGQAHQLYAYAIASTGGQLVALNGNPKELLCGRGSRGVLEGIVDGDAAVGWTYDPASPNDSSTVAFYVDAPYPSGKSAGQATTALVRNDMNQLIGASGAHGFVWSIPNDWRDGQTHKLFAYAISEKTGNQLVMGSSMPFRAQPVALSTGEP